MGNRDGREAGLRGAPVTATLTFEVLVSRTRFLAPFALAAFTLLAACDTRVVTEPQFQPQVINLRKEARKRLGKQMQIFR